MKKGTNQYYQEAVQRAVEYIETNSSKKINLKEVAKHALLSQYHFHRIFKSIIGDTVKGYLVRIRLEKSASMLKNSDRTIIDIAIECGYNSPETFTRAFGNYFSISPSGFRESIKHQFEKKKISLQEISLDTLNLSDPKIVECPDLNLAYIRHFGRYEKVGKSFQKLMIWATKNLILKLKSSTLGIVYDNPELTEEQNIRYDACILVTKKIEPKDEFGFKIVAGGKFAVFRYKGTYKKLNSIYDYIYHKSILEYNWELRDEPTLEWYIKSPIFHKPEQLVTDIYLPIN